MQTLSTLQPRERRVLLLWLLFTLLCLAAGSDDLLSCRDLDLNVTRAHGEQWLLPDCGGLATCHGSYITVSFCPRTSVCRILEEGDPSAAFPRCCPRLACPGCYSEKLDRYFDPGSSWTEGHCVGRRCQLGPSGALQSYDEPCEPLGPPPSLDCEVVEQDMSRGEYPLCCAHYRCPGLCHSGDRWQPVGVRGDSCPEARAGSSSWLPWD